MNRRNQTPKQAPKRCIRLNLTIAVRILLVFPSRKVDKPVWALVLMQQIDFAKTSEQAMFNEDSTLFAYWIGWRVLNNWDFFTCIFSLFSCVCNNVKWNPAILIVKSNRTEENVVFQFKWRTLF